MEFEESDIMFSNDYSSTNQINPIGYYSMTTSSRRCRHINDVSMKQNKGQRSCSSSSSSAVPLNIPGSNSSSPSSSFRYDGCGFDSSGDDFLDDDDNELVPPHVIVDRRSSSSSGQGKKKKNLIHFRNSILKLTGFLES